VVSRRQFLRGSFSRPQVARRPPWHVAEDDFARLCTRCGDCAEVCPTQVIVRGAAGFPEVDFRSAECSFCGECARACKTGAIAFHADAAPWDLRAAIGGNCLTFSRTVCRSCGEACAVQAIRFSPVLGGAAVPLLDTRSCTGCGACVAVCPAQAISVDPRAPAVELERTIA